MFGKGIYFAGKAHVFALISCSIFASISLDMVTKSANYCRASSADPIALMLLCEVALGNM